MAGDWIKMRDNLWDDPRVSRLCDLVGCSEAPVIGGLYWLWSNADQHSIDGAMAGLTLQAIDRKTRIKGFGRALVEVGWVVDGEEGISIPRFGEHNGESAKERAAGQKRKANWRAKSANTGTNVPQTTGQMSPKNRDKPVTQPGQIWDKSEAREEKSISNSSFSTRTTDAVPVDNPEPRLINSTSTPRAAAHSIANAERVKAENAAARASAVPPPDGLIKRRPAEPEPLDAMA